MGSLRGRWPEPTGLPGLAGAGWAQPGPPGAVCYYLGPSRAVQGRLGPLGPASTGLQAGLGPVVYSCADDLPVVYQWFTSGLLQWFTRVSMVFGERGLLF